MIDATYIKGATKVSQIPSEDPIYLLLGRSNVGKSSFINSITRRKALARTSGTPGKTIVLNFYLINKKFYLVDAPGYGYARRSKSHKDDFVLMIDDIIHNHPKIKAILLLIDFKVGPTEDDLNIYNYLKELELKIIVIATKTDKIANTKQYKQKKLILEKLGNPEYFYEVSNQTNKNIDIVRNLIFEGEEDE